MGIRALWAGFGLSMVTCIPCSIVYLGVYEQFSEKYKKHIKNKTYFVNI